MTVTRPAEGFSSLLFISTQVEKLARRARRKTTRYTLDVAAKPQKCGK
jgi:hypothetical protein